MRHYMQNMERALLGRILVVDGNSKFRDTTARLLIQEGYEVETAGGVEGALDPLGRFDLLVADVQVRACVPVLVVTNEPSVTAAVRAFRESAFDYMSRPLEPAVFLGRVAKGVERGRALRRLEEAERQLQLQLEIVTRLRAVAAPRTSTETERPRQLPAVVCDKLSPREQEVVIAFGAQPKTSDVARTLHISPHTVKNHLKSIYRKLQVSSQAELLACLARDRR